MLKGPATGRARVRCRRITHAKYVIKVWNIALMLHSPLADWSSLLRHNVASLAGMVWLAPNLRSSWITHRTSNTCTLPGHGFESEFKSKRNKTIVTKSIKRNKLSTEHITRIGKQGPRGRNSKNDAIVDPLLHVRFALRCGGLMCGKSFSLTVDSLRNRSTTSNFTSLSFKQCVNVHLN